MKKQVKKLSKKILVLGLATSLIFTSCFSYKKINAHATSVVAGLGAYTLYEICLYIGGLAVTTLGIGYAYENRDEIAQFGKSVIDSMSDLSSKEWVIGSHTVFGDYVYGTEALEEVQETQWTVIQGGGQSPKNDNDDDGDEDVDDREIELNLNGYFLTQAGINLFENHIKPIYDNWVNGVDDNILLHKFGLYGEPNAELKQDENGNYIGYWRCYLDGELWSERIVCCKTPVYAYFFNSASVGVFGPTYSFGVNTYHYANAYITSDGNVGFGSAIEHNRWENGELLIETDLPIITDADTYDDFFYDQILPNENVDFGDGIPSVDFMSDSNDWSSILKDIANSLRSLQDLTNIAQSLSEFVLNNKPSVEEYNNNISDLGNEYSPLDDYISSPNYYPSTNTTPKLDPEDFPNYDNSVEPDVPTLSNLDNYTLYEICLYFGSLVSSGLGIGTNFDNKDTVAKLGKSFIDSLSSIPTNDWLFGSNIGNDSFVYGIEPFLEIKSANWETIQSGGVSPKNDFSITNYYMFPECNDLITNHIENIFNSWVNKDSNNILDEFYGVYGSGSSSSTSSYPQDSSGNYVGTFKYWIGASTTEKQFVCTEPMVAYLIDKDTNNYYLGVMKRASGEYLEGSDANFRITFNKANYQNGVSGFETNLPIVYDTASRDDFVNNNVDIGGDSSGSPSTPSKSYKVADWIAEDSDWQGHLEDLSTSLRSLQDLFNIAKHLTDNSFVTQPSADAYGDMMVNISTDLSPSTNPINNPIYYPSTDSRPALAPEVFPNYVPSTEPEPEPDVPEPEPDNPEPDVPEPEPDNPEPDVPEIDLDGFLSLFNILFYLIMIIIMLIYLFLSCLAFIVMIFRIPASNSMLPPDMVLGFEHLQTIMIPNTNISIYGFAMALIYMFIIFAVIKLIRLEINDFKFPRSYK